MRHTHHTQSGEDMRNLDRPSVRISGIGLAFAVICVLVSAAGAVSSDNLPASPLDPALRVELLSRADQLPRLRSLLVSVNDQVVEEHYYHGASSRRAANLKSASKSIISLLVGIAIDLGHIPGVNQTITDYFPDYINQDFDLAKTEITVGHLLAMQADSRRPAIATMVGGCRVVTGYGTFSRARWSIAPVVDESIAPGTPICCRRFWPKRAA